MHSLFCVFQPHASLGKTCSPTATTCGKSWSTSTLPRHNKNSYMLIHLHVSRTWYIQLQQVSPKYPLDFSNTVTRASGAHALKDQTTDCVGPLRRQPRGELAHTHRTSLPHESAAGKSIQVAGLTVSAEPPISPKTATPA